MRKSSAWTKCILGIMAAAILLSGVRPWKAQAVSSSEIQDQIDALKEEKTALQEKIDALEAQIKDNVSQMEDVAAQKGQIDQQISLLHEQIANTNEQIASFAVLIADKQEELEAAEADLAALNKQYKERIRAMEERSELTYWSILFRANSFLDFLDRLNMIQEINASDNRRLQELRTAAARVQAAREELDSEKKSLERTRDELQQTQQTLDEKRTQADALLQELLSRGEEYDRLMEQSEREQEKLLAEIAKKENEYDRLAEEEWLATSVPATTGSSSQSGQDVPAPGNMTWITPVPYYVLTSPFGMRMDPVLHYWKMHNGVDLACAKNTPIYASRSGIVAETGYQEKGAGNYVRINHGDGYRTVYMHMTRYVVSPGEHVTAGQVIGYVGTTGWSTGYHLHFGISYNGTYVNPMEYIS